MPFATWLLDFASFARLLPFESLAPRAFPFCSFCRLAKYSTEWWGFGKGTTSNGGPANHSTPLSLRANSSTALGGSTVPSFNAGEIRPCSAVLTFKLTRPNPAPSMGVLVATTGVMVPEVPTSCGDPTEFVLTWLVKGTGDPICDGGWVCCGCCDGMTAPCCGCGCDNACVCGCCGSCFWNCCGDETGTGTCWGGNDGDWINGCCCCCCCCNCS
ncbi:hypothetical protein B0O80DRAFT_457257 [Mortierella sp. GBAus27b]|nr:hypothetical protein B0O80DRAFT_457257 [Mortierella sp. GBAus27b]